MKEQMKELYVDGLASHNGPQGMRSVSKGREIRRSQPKRCRWVRAGEVLSLETIIRDAAPVSVGQGDTTTGAMRVRRRSRGVLGPQHARKPSCTRTGRSQP